MVMFVYSIVQSIACMCKEIMKLFILLQYRNKPIAIIEYNNAAHQQLSVHRGEEHHDLRLNLQLRLMLTTLNNHRSILQQLLHRLDLDIHNPQQRIPMLTPHRLHMTLSPLGLLLDPHRLRINPHNPSPTLKHPLINIRRPLEREIPRTQHRRPVKPNHIPRLHIGHQERQPHVVARGEEVGFCVQVRADVVRVLRREVRELVQ